MRVPPPVRGLRPERGAPWTAGSPCFAPDGRDALLVLVLVTAGFAGFAVWSFSVIRGFPGDKRPEISKLEPVADRRAASRPCSTGAATPASRATSRTRRRVPSATRPARST